MASKRTGTLVEMRLPLFDDYDRDRKNANPPRWHANDHMPKPAFPGPAVEPEYDNIRLTGLQYAIFELMKDGRWRTFSDIHFAIQRGSENGIAAMLRNLRHKSRGRHTVNKKRKGDKHKGLWEYQLIVNPKTRIRPQPSEVSNKQVNP